MSSTRPVPRLKAALFGGAIVLLLLLAAAWWWPSRAASPTQPVAAAPALAPLDEGPPTAVEPEPELEPEPEPGLEDLPPARRRPRAVKATTPATRWQVLGRGCAPDQRWRDDAMRTVRELGEVAATKPLKWKEYLRREPELTKAISSANAQFECGRTSRQIAELTDAVLKE